MRTSGQGRLVVWAVLAAVTDWLTKIAAEQTLSPGVDIAFGARLQLSHNTGIAFGGLGGAPDVVVLLVVAIGIAGLSWAVLKGILPGGAPGGLLLGGATANLADRLEGSGVTDFIDVGAWPPFNLADAYITIGVALTILVASRTDNAGKHSVHSSE